MTSVGMITTSLQALHLEVRERFQRQRTPGSGIGSNDGFDPTSPTVEDVRLAAKRVELPSLNSEDPAEWIAKVEAYFTIQGTLSEMQIQLAHTCLDGMTWHWFKVLQDSEPQLSWEVLKRSLMDRYGDHQSGNPLSQLKQLQQTGTVDEYVKAFEVYDAGSSDDRRY